MPPYGLACMGGAVDSILGPLLVGLTAILVVAGLMDYLVQRAEFIRQQRMSITEMKREYKDQDGNPQIKGALRQSQRDLVQNPTGLSQATLILRDGARQMVALRYVRDDMPAPLVVARARGGAAGRAVRQALRTRPGLVVVEDAAAVAALSGVALAYVWERRATAHVKSGRLVECLAEWCPIEDGPYLYYPTRKHNSAGLRAVIEALRV